jgi:phage repressor protein C with HTH and peptisase S24 domain
MKPDGVGNRSLSKDGDVVKVRTPFPSIQDWNPVSATGRSCLHVTGESMEPLR